MLFDLLKEHQQQKIADLLQYLDSFKYEDRVAPPMKITDTIRASGIDNFCPRFESIRVDRNLTAKDTIDSGLLRIFDAGRVFEQGLRDYILGELAGHGLLLARWKCQICEYSPEQVEGRIRYPKPQTPCPKCQEEFKRDICQWTVREVYKEDSETLIGGHNDGVLYWNCDYHILEIKTANDSQFKMISKEGRPKRAHVAQAQVYMWLHGLKSACVWYFNKNNSKQMLFWLKHDPAHIQMFVERARAWRTYAQSKVMPARICDGKNCDRAKDCSLREICFEHYK